MKTYGWIVIFLLLYVLIGRADEKTCRPGVISWVDATLTQGNEIDLNKLTVTQTTFGCILETEHGYIVISNFVDNRPTMVTRVPKEWGIKVLYFVPNKKAGP